MPYDSRILREAPSAISPVDRERLMLSTTLDLQSRVVLYEEMMERYSDSHPFLLVRQAEMLNLLGSGPLAVDLYCKAQNILSRMGIVDKSFDALLEKYSAQVNDQVSGALAKSRQSKYYQTWKPTKQHRFPTNLPYPPPSSQEVKDLLQALKPPGSSFFAPYLRKLVIETNLVESTFLLTEEVHLLPVAVNSLLLIPPAIAQSTQDLVRRGISGGTVTCLPESVLKDPTRIKSILNDTLAAYELLGALVTNTEDLDKAAIRRIHACLTKTCRFNDVHYIPAGTTRTETRKTVIVTGTYNIECCPFPDVDAEVQYICKMAKVNLFYCGWNWIKSWHNPFATASWIHLILVRCHPFEDGNGRLARLLASIPLMKHGYPPISIVSTQRPDYYAAINTAYRGDHGAFVQCMLQGMQEAITSVQSL
ncbi:Adenosine monophosphate-protein transferase FICD [Hypsizygus marmoreus]|uniref:Adenosine monophosphate-protein transferase FICD n=1 Tax=Hypsizygus marmoreus TaxID=39966 RepID=A0A369J9K8_HYPMA|nr:Adenosine monophosphate-protein transferase FICD [Hypsizygus marmoreus]